MIPQPDLKPPGGIVPDQWRTLLHDLRQPLSVIETCAYCLRVMAGTASDPRVLEQLDRIEEQVFEAGLILLAAAGHPARGAGAAGSLSCTNAASSALT